MFLNLITVFTVIISLVRGQPLTTAQGLGGLLVLVGVILSQEQALRGRRAARPANGADEAEGSRVGAAPVAPASADGGDGDRPR